MEIKKEITETEHNAVGDLQSFLSLSFPELSSEIDTVESLEEMLNIVNVYSSVVNIFFLRAIASHLKLQNAIQFVQAYDDDTKNCFLKEVKVKQLCGQMLTLEINRPLLKSETLQFILKCNIEKMTLYDMQQVLINAFHTMVHHIILKKLTIEGDKICLLCYAPFSLSGEFMRLIQSNENHLHERGVVSVDIGGCIYRDIEKEVNT